MLWPDEKRVPYAAIRERMTSAEPSGCAAFVEHMQH